jgi:hypothetical protein
MTHRLTVRGHDEIRWFETDEWTVLVALAAIAARPETLEEMAEAMRRYLPQYQLRDVGHDATDFATADAANGPWCLIDLVGRTAVAGGGFELPEPFEAFQADDEDDVQGGFPIVWLDTPADWSFEQADGDWLPMVSARAEAAQPQRLDARAVLFGPPLLQFLAERVRVAAAGEGAPGEERQLKVARQIHAEWLMTAREDLGGRTPRELLLADRHHIDLDLQHRADQWSRQGHAPPPLPTDTAAYRFGSFGTSEIVLYFELVRSLLDEAQEAVEREPEMMHEKLVDRLAEHRDTWLASPFEDESGGTTAGELIEAERRRMPVTSDGSHLDCDCPICQAEADGIFGPGPAFMWFDGHRLELEDEFAFSLTESREEWEAEQQSSLEFAKEMDAKIAERQRAESQGDADASAWRTSYVDWDSAFSPDAPRSMVVLAIGFRVAELVTDLKDRPQGRPHLDSLNQAYAAFRLAQSDLAERSAAGELAQRLEQVARAFPDLVGKSADLQSRLDEMLRRTAGQVDR